ncbi:MAG: hypothetical protein AAB263_06570 [Planctomycetota bacterium]
MSPRAARSGFVLIELVGCVICLAMFTTMSVMAFSGIRQRQQVEVSSARLEEAQNLLARWRAGETLVAPDWQITVQPATSGSEILILRRPGLRLATIRPAPGGAR